MIHYQLMPIKSKIITIFNFIIRPREEPTDFLTQLNKKLKQELNVVKEPDVIRRRLEKEMRL